jgi:hypothetical protein
MPRWFSGMWDKDYYDEKGKVETTRTDFSLKEIVNSKQYHVTRGLTKNIATMKVLKDSGEVTPIVSPLIVPFWSVQ